MILHDSFLVQPDMTRTMDIKVPDIMISSDVSVIEILVSPAMRWKKETPLITLETDKATMEVPSPQTGLIKSVKIKVGTRSPRR